MRRLHSSLHFRSALEHIAYKVNGLSSYTVLVVIPAGDLLLPLPLFFLRPRETENVLSTEALNATHNEKRHLDRSEGRYHRPSRSGETPIFVLSLIRFGLQWVSR
jgi:hypothetical protein